MAELTKMETRIDKKVEEKFNSLMSMFKEQMEALRQDLRQDLTAQTAKFKENLTNLADINKADFQALKTSTEEKINVYNKEVDGKVANLANEVSEVSNRQGSENLVSTAQQQERGGVLLLVLLPVR